LKTRLLLWVVIPCLIALTLNVSASDSTAASEECAHQYTNSSVSFSWSQVDFSCDATGVCILCDETETIDCSVTQSVIPPDSSSPGETQYTASATFGGTTFTSTHTVPGLAHQHSYGTPEIRWSDDYQSAQAIAVCSLCPNNDPGKTVSASCTVRIEQSQSADCSQDGYTIYTASAALLDQTLEDRITVTHPKLPHTYSIPVFTWDKDGCSASYACTAGGETFLDACTISEQITYADCTSDGLLVKTASITLNGITYSDSIETTLPPKNHVSSRLQGKAATCTEAGMTDGITCSDCGAVLLAQSEIEPLGHTEAITEGKDATCTEDGISDGIVCAVCETVLAKQTVIPALGHTPVTEDGKPATCTDEGATGITICSVCQTVLEESTVLAPLGHRFSNSVFSWSHDLEQVYASKTCTNACGTVLQGTVTLTRTETSITAAAVFADGTTDTDIKYLGGVPTPDHPSPSPSQPSQPSQPQLPSGGGIPSGTETPTAQFDDVPSSSYFADAVAWAAEKKITQGTANRTFSPDMICSRAQIITMLWRAAGCPMISGTADFVDIRSTDYYYHAVLWASLADITSGTASDRFSPDQACSRAQIVTMLWRAAGCPDPHNDTTFTDVDADTWYADAVAWAVQSGITQGTGGNRFSPDVICTRAQCVTFLYRARNLLS